MLGLRSSLFHLLLNICCRCIAGDLDFEFLLLVPGILRRKNMSYLNEVASSYSSSFALSVFGSQNIYLHKKVII